MKKSILCQKAGKEQKWDRCFFVQLLNKGTAEKATVAALGMEGKENFIRKKENCLGMK